MIHCFWPPETLLIVICHEPLATTSNPFQSVSISLKACIFLSRWTNAVARCTFAQSFKADMHMTCITHVGLIQNRVGSIHWRLCGEEIEKKPKKIMIPLGWPYHRHSPTFRRRRHLQSYQSLLPQNQKQPNYKCATDNWTCANLN